MPGDAKRAMLLVWSLANISVEVCSLGEAGNREQNQADVCEIAYVP